jgi:diguanylate cyclase
MFDLNELKKINDIYGHEVGDLALKTVGAVLANNARTNDVLARWGGEEFIVVLPNATLEEARVIAERMRLAISRAMIATINDSIIISASIGVAASLINDKGVDELNALIKLADRQLYEAKDLGKNCIAY